MTTHIIQKGGSGHKSGIHYYQRLTQCPRQARLGEEANLVSERAISPNPNFQIGTLFHAYLELYYGGHPANAVQFTTDDGTEITPDSKCLTEAQRLFRAYRTIFKRTELGQPLCLEEVFPRNDAEKEKILEVLGVPQLTIKPDMVTKITRPGMVQELINPPDGGLSAGYYLVDYKTAGRRSDKRILERQVELQFSVYQAVWNAIFPEKTLSGCLVRVAYKLKVPIFETIYVEPIGSVGLEVVRNFFAGALHMLEVMPDWANGSACKGAWGVCGFLEKCGRY